MLVPSLVLRAVVAEKVPCARARSPRVCEVWLRRVLSHAALSFTRWAVRFGSPVWPLSGLAVSPGAARKGLVAARVPGAEALS